MEKEYIEKMLLLMLLLFSLYPSIVDIYSGITGTVINGISTVSAADSGAGYTFVHFVFMYCIGTYLQKNKIRLKKSSGIVGYCVCVCLIWLGMHLTMNMIFYNNILVVLNSIYLFIAFENSRISCFSAIRLLAKSTFLVYVIHGFMYDIWKLLKVELFLTNGFKQTVLIFVIAIIVMYTCSVIIATLGRWGTMPVVKFMRKIVRYEYSVEIEDGVNEKRID